MIYICKRTLTFTSELAKSAFLHPSYPNQSRLHRENKYLRMSIQVFLKLKELRKNYHQRLKQCIKILKIALQMGNLFIQITNYSNTYSIWFSLASHVHTYIFTHTLENIQRLFRTFCAKKKKTPCFIQDDSFPTNRSTPLLG